MKFSTRHTLCENCGFHGSDNNDDVLLGFDAVRNGQNLPTSPYSAKAQTNITEPSFNPFPTQLWKIKSHAFTLQYIVSFVTKNQHIQLYWHQKVVTQQMAGNVWKLHRFLWALWPGVQILDWGAFGHLSQDIVKDC